MLTELERIIEYRRQAHRLQHVDVEPLPSPLVRLSVADQAVVVPRAELADSVRWVDERADWTFRRGGAVSIDDYLAWRSEWETAHELGSISSLRDLVAAMRHHGVEPSPQAAAALQRLLSDTRAADDNRLPTAELFALQDSLGEFAAAVRSSGSLGVALVESSPTINRTGLLRSWPSSPAAQEQASRGTVTVRFSGARLGVWFADDRNPITDVRSFELGVEGAVVADADGNAHVLDGDATDAMCAVAPETTAWRVRRIPEILVWADLLEALETASDAVRACGGTPRISLGDERHAALAHAD